MHAIEQYSREEWDQIWCESDGYVCGLLAGESPAQPRSRRAILLGAQLTAISPLMAQTGRVRIRVTDRTGSAITTAEASLLGGDGKPVRTADANDAGEIAFTALPLGDSRFAVIAQGFSMRPVTVTVRNGDELKIEAILDVGTVGGAATIEPVSVALDAPAPALSAPVPAAKRTKRRRWLIFR
jgi:hypothetical protein